MSTREALHKEIDMLPDSVLETLFCAFGRQRDDPFRFMLDNAPIDDEPESEVERAAVAIAKASTGPFFTTEQVGELLEAML